MLRSSPGMCNTFLLGRGLLSSLEQSNGTSLDRVPGTGTRTGRTSPNSGLMVSSEEHLMKISGPSACVERVTVSGRPLVSRVFLHLCFITVPLDEDGNIDLLQRIVAGQREIFSTTLSKPAEQVPQLWCLYSEVKGYYVSENGTFGSPDTYVYGYIGPWDACTGRRYSSVAR